MTWTAWSGQTGGSGGGGAGTVTGPSSSTTGNVAVFKDATGQVLDQTSAINIDTVTKTINMSGTVDKFLQILPSGGVNYLVNYYPGDATTYIQFFMNSARYLRGQLANALDSITLQALSSTDGIHFWLLTSGSADALHMQVLGSAFGAAEGQVLMSDVSGNGLCIHYPVTGNFKAYGAVATGYYYENTNASFTVPDGKGAVIVDYGTLKASGTITMPAAPIDGMQLSFGSGTNGTTALTLTPNSGQTIIGGITTLVAGTAARYMYKSSNLTWYRIG